MSMPPALPLISVEEYLQIERSSDERHTFLDGEIFAMAGESGEHGDISVNVVVSLGSQLKGSPCRARTKDTKVRSGPEPKPPFLTKGLFCYPDIAVICGEPEYHDEHRDVVLNPAAILEVLSPATEAFDRGEKFTRYQTWNPTLMDYVLISQDRPQIEQFSRNDDGTWSYRLVTGLEASVSIESIKCTLRLAEVYYRVAFSEES